MTKYKYIILLFLSFLPCVASAEAIYKCDFEDPKECAKWHLEPIISATKAEFLANKWYIGTPGNFSPEEGNGLYISSDGGKTASYDALNDYSSYVITWRTLSIPKGDYDLYFDWKAMGKPSGTDAIYVYWVTDNTIELKSDVAAMSISSKYEPYFIGDTLSLASTWQKAHFQFKNESSDSIRLVFIWNTDPENLQNPAACIDNIEIHQKNNCEAPFNISHSISPDGTVHLKWKGHGDMYSTIYYDPETQEVNVVDSIIVGGFGGNTTPSFDIENLTQGVRTIYIRSYCKNTDGTYNASDYTPYTLLVYANSEGCIPFLDLSKAKCYVTSMTNAYRWSNPTDPVDRGYASSLSRHTIHYAENEYDPRTDNKLKTVPFGNYASVRLGNWEVNSESERIEYSFTPQKGESDILKIKYAVVMNSDIPEEWKHNKSDQPKFNLDIYYIEGKDTINYNRACYSVDFSAGYIDGDGDVDSEWNLHYTNEEKTIGVYWKDWDSLSISLSEFVGKETIIRLTTRDCNNGGHYGYAYFTLDCEAGTLFGTTCGKFNNQFIAPDGFENYVWFRESDLNTPLTPDDRTRDGQRMVSDDGKMLTIDNDDISTYVLRVYFNEENDCYFTLFANGLPRIPIAKADTVNVHISSCQYVVGFKNESFINIRDDRFSIDSIDANMKPDYFEWIFEDTTIVTGSLSEIITYRYAEGGDKIVYLKAGLTTCDTTTIDTIRFHLAPLGNMEHTTRKDICIGGCYTYMDADNKPHMYMDNIEQDFTWPLGQGCDSIDHFILVVHDTLYHDTLTLCPSSLPYHIDGCSQTITGTGDYRAVWKSKLCDCDSIILWHVNLEGVEVETDNVVLNCVDGDYLDIPYQLIAGAIDSICIQFTDKTPVEGQSYCFAHTMEEGTSIHIPLSPDVAPGRYPAILSFKSASVCPAAEKHIVVEISYSASVIGQKGHNGWIGLHNDERFENAQFQWFRDGTAIPGATKSYYPIAENDYGHTFYVVVTQNGDTEGISTCPVIYGTTTALEKIPVGLSHCEVYTILGEKVYEGDLSDCSCLHPFEIYIVRYPNTNEILKISIH